MKSEKDERPEDVEEILKMLPQKYRLAILARAANKTLSGMQSVEHENMDIEDQEIDFEELHMRNVRKAQQHQRDLEVGRAIREIEQIEDQLHEEDHELADDLSDARSDLVEALLDEELQN